MTVRCRDCMRRALPGSPWCATCGAARATAIADAQTPAWLRRGREGLARAKDLSGAAR